jgi:hypothetical protein
VGEKPPLFYSLVNVEGIEGDIWLKYKKYNIKGVHDNDED